MEYFIWNYIEEENIEIIKKKILGLTNNLGNSRIYI